MPDNDMGALTAQVLWAAFGLSVVFGVTLLGVGGVTALGCSIDRVA